MTVEERIAALEQTVAELRAELAKRKVWHSMARTLTCPSCGGGSIIGINHLVVPAVGDLTLQPKTTVWKSRLPGDPLLAYVCKDCKLVEWRVGTMIRLRPDGKHVFELQRPDDEGTPPSTDPYR